MSELSYNKQGVRVSNPTTRRTRGILKLHTSLHKGTNCKPDATYAIPSPENEKKSGPLEKLSSNGDNCWVPVTGILAEGLLYFSPKEKLQMSDSIPVTEISDLRAFDDTVEINLKASEIGPAWSKSFNNLDRLADARIRDTYPFVIYTTEKGYNGGRTYFLRANSEDDRLSWIEAIGDRVAEAYKAALTDRSRFRRIRYEGRKVYNHHLVQKFVALLIFSNFMINCFDAQYQPEEGTEMALHFRRLDVAFTAIFTFELSINMFLHWFWPFWTGPDWQWNVFDTIVIMVAVLSLSIQRLQTFSLLRTVRAFRVFRLFRRLKTLALLMLAFYRSIGPIISCLVVLALITCIYSIMGVDLFREDEPELFGSLPAAIFTVLAFLSSFHLLIILMQLCRCFKLQPWTNGLKDSFVLYPTGILRRRYTRIEHMLDLSNCSNICLWSVKSSLWQVYFFFGTFAIVGGMVLMTVFFAVLLDEFSRSYIAEKNRRIEKKERQQAHDELTWPLDPVIEALLLFENEIQLEAMITQIFQLLDKNSSGWVTYDKMSKGLKQLQSHTTIHISKEEYDFLANLYAGNRKRKFDLKTFSDMIHHQLLLYSNRCLTRKHHNINSSAAQYVMFNAVKLLSLQVAKISLRGNQDRDVLADLDDADAKEARKLFESDTRQRLDSIDEKLSDFTDAAAGKFRRIERLINALEAQDFETEPAATAAAAASAKSGSTKGSESAGNPVVDTPYKAAQADESQSLEDLVGPWSRRGVASGVEEGIAAKGLSQAADAVDSGRRRGLDADWAGALDGGPLARTQSRGMSNGGKGYSGDGGKQRGFVSWEGGGGSGARTKILTLPNPLRNAGSSRFRSGRLGLAAQGGGQGDKKAQRNLYLGDVEHHEQGPYLMTVNLHDLRKGDGGDNSSDEMALL